MALGKLSQVPRYCHSKDLGDFVPSKRFNYLSLLAIAANNEKGTPQTFARPKMAHLTTNNGLLRGLLLILVECRQG